MQAQLRRIDDLARQGRQTGRMGWGRSAGLTMRAVQAYNRYARNAQAYRDTVFAQNGGRTANTISELLTASRAANNAIVPRRVYMGLSAAAGGGK